MQSDPIFLKLFYVPKWVTLGLQAYVHFNDLSKPGHLGRWFWNFSGLQNDLEDFVRAG